MKEVSKWLQEIGFGHLEESFRSQEIDSLTGVLQLGSEDLKELIPLMGPRNKFKCYLAQLLKESQGEESTVMFSHEDTPPQPKSNKEEIVPLLPAVSEAVKEADKLSHTGDSGIGNDSINEELVENPNDLDLEESCEPGCSGLQERTSNVASKSNVKKRKRNEVEFVSKLDAKYNGLENIKSLNIEDVLKKHSLKSEAALDHFKLNNYLTSAHRSYIVAALATELLRHNYTPSHEEYEKLTEKLLKLFPVECSETWYVPASDDYPAAGKLPNKVKNLKYSLKEHKAGKIQIVESVPRTKGLCKEAELPGSTDPKNPEILKATSVLKHESRDNWPLILSSWSTTHALRHKLLRETRPGAVAASDNSDSEDEEIVLVNQYIQDWNILKLPAAFLLLKQDFNELYPGYEDCLLTKWEGARDLIVELAEKELGKADDFGATLMKQYKEAPKDKRDVIAFFILPSLFCKRGRGKGQAATTAKSLQEARKAFILHVLIPGDLNRSVKNHHHHLASLGVRLQPFLVFVGPSLSKISACYVQIDNLRFDLRTPLAALDCCFKAFFALDAAYPHDCKSVWYFVQWFFFELSLQEDEKIPTVKGIISSLKGLASKEKL